MRHNLLTIVLAVILAPAISAVAQPLLPPQCSSQDRDTATQYASQAVGALARGETNQFIRLLRESESRLSQRCRNALAALPSPASRCSAEEKETVLNQYQGILADVWNGDVPQMLVKFIALEEELSEECWIAINYARDPRVLRACTAEELTMAASAAGPAYRGMLQAMQGDPLPLLQLVQNLTQRLSPACQQAAAEAGQQARPAGNGQLAPRATRQQQLPSVFDHGAGVYTMTGVGGCTPSGCVAF